ncbi:MAG: trypsin-like peptidase domain-containing protein [Planctomycetota bacterium]|nr:trypsin-like peptidase domain-containing protein [Planctomycetota bacterium]
MRNWRKRTVVAVAVWAMAFLVSYLGYQYFLNQQFARAEDQREEVRAGLAKIDDLASAFRQVGKIVEPSVVNIQVIRKTPVARRKMDQDLLRRFFRDREGGEGELELPPGIEIPDEDFLPEQIGTGSGVIMEYSGGKGYVLTNNHVAGGADSLEITLADGRKFRNAKVIGADPKTDLAVLEVPADRLSAAKWGNSDETRQGDWVLAFGSPFGYVGSMTHGIVSALHRQADILGTGGNENFIQVDAPINPGNSGGPLVNLRGEVIGINTAIASRNGGFQGIGFAIPSNQAKFVYSQLKDKGKVVRGWLGVGIKNVADEMELAKSYNYQDSTGVLVDEAIKGTPAYGKLEHGDIVTKVNGKPVEDSQQLRAAIALMPPGTDVDMDVFHDGKTQKVTIKLGEQPENLAAARGSMGRQNPPGESGTSNFSSLGLQVMTLTPELADQRGLELKSGAIITRVDRGSPAAKQGLQRGDVISEVGKTQIKTADDFGAALKKVDLKKGVRMYVTTPQGSRLVFLSAEK